MPVNDQARLLKNESGFSLIELMIVVAIIGILSSIAVPNMERGIKTALARSHLKQIVAGIKPLRITDDRVVAIKDITLNGYSAGPYVGQDLRTATISSGYVTTWQRLGFDRVPLDPWGRPYMLDENDEEFVGDCRMDSIISAGPDGIYEGPGDGDDVGGDDIIARVPLANKTTCQEHPVTGGY